MYLREPLCVLVSASNVTNGRDETMRRDFLDPENNFAADVLETESAARASSHQSSEAKVCDRLSGEGRELGGPSPHPTTQECLAETDRGHLSPESCQRFRGFPLKNVRVCVCVELPH